MMKTFCEKSGRNADQLGDVGIRLQAVAMELHSLSCYGDFVIRQAFPQTANSKYLDEHARIRGTSRKKPTKAKVNLKFSLAEPLSENLILTRDIVCATQDKPYIQFSPERTVVIPAGETSITVESAALSEGEEYNVGANAITVIVNPPAGVAAVTNPKPAIGGFSGENDEMLRRRLINTYKAPSNGLTITSMASLVEALDEIVECRIIKNDKILDVYVRTPNDALTAEVIDKVKNVLASADLLGLATNIICAKPVYVDVTALGSFNARKSSSTYSLIEDVVKQALSSNGIGRGFELDELIRKCIHLQEINQISFASSLAENGVLSINNNEYLVLKDFEVIENA